MNECTQAIQCLQASSLNQSIHQYAVSEDTEHSPYGDILLSKQVSTSHSGAIPPVFICNICKKSYESLDNYDEHIKEAHTSLQCCICDKYLRSLPDLNYHKHKHHTPGPDTCATPKPTAASTPWRSEDERAEGFENLNQSYQFTPCLEFSKTTFICQNPLPDPVSHQHADPLLHGGAKCCNECGCLFTRQDDLEKHEQRVHGDKDTMIEVHCHVCAAPFKSMRSLNIHAVTNHGHQTDSSTFFCALCPTTIFSAHDLKKHLENYHGVFHTTSCEICGMIFINKQYLSHHMKNDHKTQESCDGTFCGNMPASEDYQVLHLQTDHGHHQYNELSCIRQYDGNDSVDGGRCHQ